ncbi:hypothetical protein ACIRP0_09310 [Streptomyces sp. NPDC101733]|uniref:hypothetical protein n=1 Tax=unclassified Streptomyces TaxID=2593676 RepID=UPI003822E21D
MTTSTPQAGILDEPGPPEPPRRAPGRVLAAALCGLLGAGLLAGAGATAWGEHRDAHRPPPPDAAYRAAAALWHSAPVDRLLPPVLEGPGAGPGRADRSWIRTALAPDADCAAALAPEWRTALAATGCTRVLRATYTDATRSSLVTVGLVFTPADAAAMAGLRGRLPAPRAYEFADARRAAWTTGVVPEAPVVVYAVSAFADGRTTDAPVPAEEATRQGATGTAAEAGLGHAAQGASLAVERALAVLAAPPGSPGAATPDNATGATTPEPRR